MPGVGWAAYQGEDENFFVEQTKLEEKQQERIRQAERDGVDLFEDHENDIVTAGDCLYGVSRGANDMAETAATKAKADEEAASKSERTSAAARSKTKVKTKKGARDFNNTFDRHRTEIVLANRNLQAKKAEEKLRKDKPFAHSAQAEVLRKKILSGDVASLPKSHQRIVAPPTDPTKQTIPLDVDSGGRRIVKSKKNSSRPTTTDGAGATTEDVFGDDLDAEMAALVDGAVEEAKEKKKEEEEKKEEATKTRAAATANKAKGKKGGAPPPAWAMTETEADELEAAEEEELLAFADNLDFDGYLEAIDEEDLNEAKAALDALVAAAAEEGGDFDENPEGGNQSAEHLARVEAWKGKFLEAINRVREAEDKVNARKTAIRTARAAVALADTSTNAAYVDTGAFATDGGAVSEKEKAADAEAKRMLENFPELAKVHSTRSLKGVLERTAKPFTPGQSRPGMAASAMSLGGGGGGGANADVLAAALQTVEE